MAGKICKANVSVLKSPYCKIFRPKWLLLPETPAVAMCIKSVKIKEI